MKKYFLFIISVIAIFQIGCDSITGGLILDVELPEHTPVLTPHCFINASDSTLEVNVQQSQGVLDDIQERFIDNATVELYKNGTLWNTFPYNDTSDVNGTYSIKMNEPFSVEGFGDTYELRVSATDFETTSAVQVMPTPVEPVEVNFVERGAIDQFGELLDVVQVTFDDPADEDNYYMVSLNVDVYGLNAMGDTIRNSQSWGETAIRSNPSTAEGYGGVIAKDDLFNGQRHTLDIGVWTFFAYYTSEEITTTTGRITVVLYSMTRDEYLYQKSLETYANSQGIFNEPTLLHSNMSQGLGVFTMMVSSKKVFDFVK